jgi:predicted MPP superfamily phosphohydrolase
MHALTRTAPVFAVKGNWDVWYFRELERFDGTAVRALDGDSAVVDAGGTKVRVAGLAFDHEEGLDAALGGAAPGELTVLLYHTPELIPDLDGRAAPPDLYLCGHTHGGQVRLPFYGAVITLSRMGKAFEAGLYALSGGTRVYVNRGLGMEGGPAPRVRFLCRPEITVLEIVPAAR